MEQFLDEDDPNYAWYLSFDGSNAYVDYDNRCVGQSVRGVATSAEGNKTINLPSTSGTLALDNVATDTTDGLMSSSDKSKIDNIENTYLPLAGGTMNKDADITLISDNNQAVLNSKGLTLDVASLDNLELKLQDVSLNQSKLSIAGGNAYFDANTIKLISTLLTSESLVFSDTGLKLGGTNLLEFKSNETMKSLWFGDSDNYSYIRPNGGFEIGVVSSYVTKNNIPNTYIKICTGNKLPGSGYGIQTNTWISSLGDWSTYLFLSNPLYGLQLAQVRLNSQGLSLPHAAQYKNPIVRSLPYTNENPAQNEGISPFYTIGPKDTSFTTEYDAVAPLVQDSTDTSKWYIPNQYINADYLPLTGGTMTGNITLKGNTVKTISSAETHTQQSIVTPEIIRVVWDDSLTQESNETRITATEVTTPKLVVTGTSSDDILLGDGETTSLSSIQKQITTNKNAIDEINNKLTWTTIE